jgi:hypothetical protein
MTESENGTGVMITRGNGDVRANLESGFRPRDVEIRVLGGVIELPELNGKDVARDVFRGIEEILARNQQFAEPDKASK